MTCRSPKLYNLVAQMRRYANSAEAPPAARDLLLRAAFRIGLLQAEAALARELGGRRPKCPACGGSVVRLTHPKKERPQ